MSEQSPNAAPPSAASSGGRHALLVGAGIFLSRIFGLVRQRVLSHYLGLSDAADAFTAAFRIPNFLQNLFGEGVLSASFIPVYSQLLGLSARDAILGESDDEVAADRERARQEAQRVAGAVVSLLALMTAVLVLVGVVVTPWIIDLIAPGFHGAKRELTVRLVRIFFPGAGLLVLSAWCLGILNSHRKFLLSYTAPVVWSLAIIVALIAFGARVGPFDLAVVAAWGSVIGSALQFAVQLPSVFKLVPGLRPSLEHSSESVREVIRNFVPAFVGRGVVQISAYVDTLLASLLGTGAVAALLNAQTLYTLPVSLFGMSVSAAQLPAMSSAVGDHETIAAFLRQKLADALRQIAFFVVPSAMAFLALGDVVAGALFQTGRFRHADTLYVWGLLAGSAVGLLASTLGRLYSSTFYALRDTRTPLNFAVVRVVLTTGLGYLFAIPLPHLLGINVRWGAAGLTASAGIAGWVEFMLLRRALRARIDAPSLAPSFLASLWGAAVLAAAAGWGVKLLVGSRHPILLAVASLGAYGIVYWAVATALRIPEARSVTDRVARLLGRGQPRRS